MEKLILSLAAILLISGNTLGTEKSRYVGSIYKFALMAAEGKVKEGEIISTSEPERYCDFSKEIILKNWKSSYPDSNDLHKVVSEYRVSTYICVYIGYKKTNRIGNVQKMGSGLSF
jgi:hypothetical protein